MLIRRILVFIVFMAIGFYTNAQTKLVLETKATSNQIELRWAPVDVDSWQEGMKYGYHIYRIKIKENGKLSSKGEAFQLTDKPIKIANKDVWQNSKDTSDAFLLAASALFGEFETTSGGSGAKSLREQFQVQNGRFVYSLLAADMSIYVAQLSALYYVDTIVDPNATYFYTVQVANGQTKTNLKASKMVGVKYENDYLTDSIQSFEISANEKQVLLSWKKDSRLGLNYTHYSVFRSERQNEGYYRVNEHPILSVTNDGKLLDSTLLFFKDSIPVFNKKYFYKVAGRNIFGDWSPLTDPLSVTANDMLDSEDFQFKASRINNKVVNLTWIGNPEQSLITGYDILRSSTNLGKYEKINSKEIKSKERLFVDEKPLRENYYMLVVHTENEDYTTFSRHIHMIDEDPPIAPTGLKADVDSNGVVTLSWNRNMEDDIDGYTVFMGSSKESEYSNVSKKTLSDTFFIDTINLNTLTKFAYYKVLALDNSNNPSPLSLPLSVKRPDIIAPTSPVIVTFKSYVEGIYIEWKCSSSEDVEKNILYREKDKGFLEEIYVFEKEQLRDSVFIDTTAKVGQEYVYSFVAVDDAGLRSPKSNKIVVERQRVTVRPAIQVWEVNVSKKTHQAKLIWQEKSKDLEAFVIYRALNDGIFVAHVRVSGVMREYFDALRQADVNYSYKIRAIYKDGSSSQMSELKTIHY